MEPVVAYLGTLFLGWLVGFIKGKLEKNKLGQEVVDATKLLIEVAKDRKLTVEEIKAVMAQKDEIVKAYKARKK